MTLTCPCVRAPPAKTSIATPARAAIFLNESVIETIVPPRIFLSDRDPVRSDFANCSPTPLAVRAKLRENLATPFARAWAVPHLVVAPGHRRERLPRQRKPPRALAL